MLKQKKVQCMTYSIILFCIVHPMFPLITFSNTLNFLLDGILDKKKIHVHVGHYKCQMNAATVYYAIQCGSNC